MYLTCMRQWRILKMMQFIETSIFTRQVISLLADDEYSQLQATLLINPDTAE